MDKKRLERLFVIHQKLRTMQGYTSQELIRVIADKLEQYISDRTLRDDIEDLRNMGAEIPKRAKSYGYKVPFSFLEALDDSYYGSLNEAVALIRQVSKNTEFVGLEDILLRLEQRISVTEAEKSAIIEFEEVILKGKELLPRLYQNIQKGHFLRVKYKPFHKPEYERHIFPLALKEYNHRWFLIGWEKGETNLQNLALDRIEDIRASQYDVFAYDKKYNWQDVFENMIGVTIEGVVENVTLRFSEARFQYVQTKKLHPSQQEIGDRTIKIRVYTNRELKAKILEYGTDIEALSPPTLRKEIKELLQKASDLYKDTDSVNAT